MGAPVPDVAPLSTDVWRQRARTYADERVRPVAESIDRDDSLPDAVVHGLRAPGFFGLGVPAEQGGSGGDTRAVAAVLEELSIAGPVLITTPHTVSSRAKSQTAWA